MMPLSRKHAMIAIVLSAMGLMGYLASLEGTILSLSSSNTLTVKNQSVVNLQFNATPYERCMYRLNPQFERSNEIYLHSPRGKNSTISLNEAFHSNTTTIYFLHLRKAGGTTIREILYRKLVKFNGVRAAESLAWVPCYTPKKCSSYELPLYETNYLGSVKLVAAHMSYHVPFARSVFEDQVLITNFREPISRIKSCMLFRYPGKTKQVFGSRNFTYAKGEELVLNQRDAYQSTCMQEPLRILSPLDPDKEPLSKKNIQRICCMVRSNFHVIRTPPPAVLGRTTRIERDIMHAMNTTHKQVTRTFLPQAAETNLNLFLEHLRQHPLVQAETELYNCVTNDEHNETP